jgi:transcriptional regulator with XRE-family HTH domain
MALSKTVRQAINAELTRQGMSQRELARKLGFSQQYLWRRLSPAVRADMEFTTAELDRIADVLGVPVTTFLAPVA